MEKEDRKIKTRVEKDRDSKKAVNPRGAGQRQEQQQKGSGYGPLLTSSLGNNGLGLFFNGLMVQAKLKVGQTGDQYEREADRVADELVTNDSSTQGLKSNVSKVQAKGSPAGKSMTGNAESQVKSMPGDGRSLDKETRDYFEPRFGVDLGNVKIHTDKKADNMAQTLNARALTYGNNIAFAGGQYRPNTLEGKKLIAHELTHVLQQSGETVQRSTNNEEEQQIPDEREVDRFPQGFDQFVEAKKLYDAFDGWGTDERMVLDVLTTGRTDMVRAIEKSFNIISDTPLLTRLHEELSGEDLELALILLEKGKLTLKDKIREVLRDFKERGTLNTEKLYHNLMRASGEELVEVTKDKKLYFQLSVLLPEEEWDYVKTFLSGGEGILAAQLLNAVDGWGTDEQLIWRSISQANEKERKFILGKEKLMNRMKADLNDEDYLKLEKLLSGNLSNLDKIEMATMGWGTDEAMLLGALRNLASDEFSKLPGGVEGLIEIVESELSGAKLEEATSLIHQKRLAFDETYMADYMERMQDEHKPGKDEIEGMSILFPDKSKDENESLSVIDKLKIAAAGAGTDEKSIWHILNGLNSAQRSFLLKNPEGVLTVLESDLSGEDYKKVETILRGGVESAIVALREAVSGWGSDTRLIYDTIDKAINERLGKEILADRALNIQIASYISIRRYEIFRDALKYHKFSQMTRLEWATTAAAGTDEELVYELCKANKNEWYKDGKVIDTVDKILDKELKTRDYWKALDIMRPEPQTEEEKIARAKEMLERERGGLSTIIMDEFSYSGQNADEAWRDYNSSYNQAIEDGKLTKEEQEQVTQNEEYSKAMTEEYRAAKATVANWASSIAVAIVGVVATIVTGGMAAPFVATLGAKVLAAATAMAVGAVAKVGINKAIQGEGYDLASTEAFIDALSASVEVGLSLVGGNIAGKFMEKAGKAAMFKSIGPSIQKTFGKAGTAILKEGVEGAIDGTIGGVGEGLIRGLADEATWANGVEGFFTNMGKNVSLQGALGGVGGFLGGAGLKSITETFGSIKVGPGKGGSHTAKVDELLPPTTQPEIKALPPSSRPEVKALPPSSQPEIKALPPAPPKARFEVDPYGNTVDLHSKAAGKGKGQMMQGDAANMQTRFEVDPYGNTVDLQSKAAGKGKSPMMEGDAVNRQTRFEVDADGNTVDLQSKAAGKGKPPATEGDVVNQTARFEVDAAGNVKDLNSPPPVKTTQNAATKPRRVALDRKSIKRSVDRYLKEYIEKYADKIDSLGLDIEKIANKAADDVAKYIDNLTDDVEELTTEGLEKAIKGITDENFTTSLKGPSTTAMKTGYNEQYLLEPPVKKSEISPHEAVFVKGKASVRDFGSYDGFISRMEILGSEGEILDIVNKLAPLFSQDGITKFDSFTIILNKKLGGEKNLSIMLEKFNGIDNLVTVIDSFGNINNFSIYFNRGGTVESILEVIEKLDNIGQLKRLLAGNNDFSKLTDFIKTNVGEGKIANISELEQLLDEFGSIGKVNDIIDKLKGVDNLANAKARFEPIGLKLSTIVDDNLTGSVINMGIDNFAQAVSKLGYAGTVDMLKELPEKSCRLIIDSVGSNNFYNILETVGARELNNIFERMGADSFLNDISRNSNAVSSFIDSIRKLGPDGFIKTAAVRELKDIPGFKEAVKKAGDMNKFMEIVENIGGVSDFARAARKNGRIDDDFIKLMSNVANSAKDIIENPGERKLNDILATAQAGVPGMKLKEKTFQNIPCRPYELEEAGITRLSKETFKVTDPEKLITQIDDLYRKKAKITKGLHPVIKRRLRKYLGTGDKLFSVDDGVPGLHAEVLAVTDVLHQLSEIKKTKKIKIEIKDIRVATFKLAHTGKGKSFEACNNCGNILEYFTILTGRVN